MYMDCSSLFQSGFHQRLTEALHSGCLQPRGDVGEHRSPASQDLQIQTLPLPCHIIGYTIWNCLKFGVKYWTTRHVMFNIGKQEMWCNILFNMICFLNEGHNDV
ncbi:hypothetical protein DPMN_027749 [Dreissena polymorpha]|uniref:Uncharacterized protein n=1 Tax=Dreissena polymorpha TaxID=45954 RepID=A0A9D4LVW9_DREPO|nr:hypothetical protein DPMN_027749 [Dreissena polymorpha]